MPEYSYTRELVSGKYNIHFSNEKVKLHKEIKDAFPGKTLNYINCHGLDVKIGITETLSGAEQTTLDTVVQDHKDNAATNITDAAAYPATDINLIIEKSISNASYEIAGSFTFRGTDILGIPSNIKAVLNIASATDGSIRIYDVTNAQTICELLAFTDTNPTITDLGALSNLPTEEALFEIQLKRAGTGGQSSDIHSLSVHF